MFLIRQIVLMKYYNYLQLLNYYKGTDHQQGTPYLFSIKNVLLVSIWPVTIELYYFIIINY